MMSGFIVVIEFILIHSQFHLAQKIPQTTHTPNVTAWFYVHHLAFLDILIDPRIVKYSNWPRYHYHPNLPLLFQYHPYKTIVKPRSFMGYPSLTSPDGHRWTLDSGDAYLEGSHKKIQWLETYFLQSIILLSFSALVDLVGGFPGKWLDDFSIGNVIIPIDELIFFSELKPPTSACWWICWYPKTGLVGKTLA